MLNNLVSRSPRAPDAPTVMFSTGPTGTVFGPTGNTTWFDLIAPVVLPAGSFMPGDVFELDALINFPTAIAGKAVQFTINGTLLAQSFPNTTMLGLSTKYVFVVSQDGATIRCFSQNLNDVLSPTAGQGAPFSVRSSALGSVAINTNGTNTLRLQTRPVNGDTVQLLHASLVRRRGAFSLLPTNAINAWGDSLTSGVGASNPVGGWPAQVRIAQPGRQVESFGIGGQTAAQIVDRMVADQQFGRRGIIVSWIGRNDVGVAADLTATVMAQHTRARQQLAPGAVYLPCTILPAATETSGSALHNAILAANAAILAAYPTTTINMFAALATEPDGTVAAANRFDNIHLNDAGYTIARDTVQARLTALGL